MKKNHILLDKREGKIYPENRVHMKKGPNNFIHQIRIIGINARFVITILVICCFMIGFGLAFKYIPVRKITSSSNSQITQINPVSTEQATRSGFPADQQSEITLTLSSQNKDVAKGDSFQALISLESTKTGIEAADIVINFDSAYVQITDVKEGNFFNDYPIKSMQANSLKISGNAKIVNNSLVIPKGKGTFATLTFKALDTVDSTKISFDGEKTVIASGGINLTEKTKINDLYVRIR